MSDAIGQAATSLGNFAPSFLGGGASGPIAQFGNYMSPGNVGLMGGSSPYFPPPPTDTPSVDVPSMTAGSFPAPGTITAASLPSELPPTAVTPEGAPFSPTGGTPGATGAQLAATGGTPADPSWWHSFLYGGQPSSGTAAAGAAGSRGGWPGLLSAPGLGLLANMGTGALKFIQQRNLLNPADVARQAQQLQAKETAAFKRAIAAPAIAAGQETGQINAPYMMDQAIAQTAAPYVYSQYPESMSNYLNSQELAAMLYPELNSFVPQGTFG